MLRARAEEILKVYGEAWMRQDPDLILTIFTPNATYAERAFEAPHAGHAGIRAYWEKKVVREQSDIRFRLLDLFIDGETIIAEWEAAFTDEVAHDRIELREVAIMTVRDGLVSSLREYWQSRRSQ